jgi:hypothetical protein
MEDSVKDWVCKYDGGRRDPSELSRTVRPPSDIVEALLKVMSELPFSSTKYITAQLQTSRKSVKGTLIEVLGMKNSVCDGFLMN